MKKICTLFILSVICISTYGQETRYRVEPKPYYPPLENPTSIILKNESGAPTTSSIGVGYTSANPSPEIGRANELQDIPVNLYTGTPQINIPLASISEGRVGVGLSLNYNPSQNRTHSMSGWAGLGWELNGIPSISRIVRGFPDEGSLSNGVGRKGYYFYGTSLPSSDISQDKEADIFFLNTGSGTLKFMFDRNKRVHFFPETDIKMEVEWINHPNEVGSNHFARKFTEFKVTMPNGIIYYFPISNVEESAEVEVKEAQTNQYYPFGNNFLTFLDNNIIANAWNCSKIESPYGETINFDYNKIAYTFYKLAEDQEDETCPFTVSKKINKVYIRGAQINKISSPQTKIAFNDGREICDIDYSVTPPETVCTYLVGSRYDIDSWGNAPTNESASKILLNITVSKNENFPSIQSFIQFNHEYFNGSDSAGLPSTYTTADVGTTHKKRLKLKSLIVSDNTVYYFSYLNEADTLGSRFSYGVDHWGYANGKEGNLKGLIGADYLNTNLNCSSDRSVNFSFAQKHVLTGINNTRGTQTLLEYEANQASNHVGDVGGLRIKTIQFYDLIRNQGSKKSYQYLNQDETTSSGFLSIKPIYRLKSSVSDNINSGLYGSLISEAGRPIVGYKRVIEKNTSLDDSIEIGKTVWFFDQDETEGSIKSDPTCTSNCEYLPTRFNLFHDFRMGSLLRQETYNQSNDTLQVLEYKYTANNGIKYDSTYCVKFYYQSGAVNISNSRAYYEIFKKYRPERQISRQYSRDGTGVPVTQIVDYTYKDEMPLSYRNLYKGKHNMPVQTSTTDEAGTAIVTLNKYTADFNFDSFIISICDPACPDDPRRTCPHPLCFRDSIVTIVPPAASEARGIFESVEKHIYDYSVESLVKMNDKAVQASYQSYFPSSSPHSTLPKNSSVLRVIPKANFQEVVYNETTFEMNKDLDYGIPRGSVLSYNNKGMPLSSSVNYGSRSSQAYDSFGSLSLSSISNSGKNDSLTSSVTYIKEFQGISTKVSPNNMETRYTYESGSNRLLEVRDHSNRVISSYNYNVNVQGQSSNLQWDIGQRSKQCSGGLVTLTTGILGLLPGSIVEFSTDGGSTWLIANSGLTAFTYSLTPNNGYQNFKARPSDDPSQVISLDYHTSCTTSPPLAFGSNSCINVSGVCQFSVSVIGLATDSYAEFSIDNINWFRANIGDDSYNIGVPYGAGGSQQFWFRAAEDHSQIGSSTIAKCP